MSVKALQDPILDQGVRNTHFFEGRLLTGEDLRNQRDADREHDRRLGRAIGPGIVEGLEVELLHDGADGEPPRVCVKKGLAVNAEGDVVGLPKNDITLALADPRTPPQWEQADFYTCAGPPDVQHLPSGAGVYILVMSPVAGYQERALKSGLGEDGVAKGCGSKYIQEGVRFRLVEMNEGVLRDLPGVGETTANLLDELFSANDPPTKGEPQRLSRLRNILAHLCFGTEYLDDWAANPWPPTGQTAAAPDALAALGDLGELGPCDVPLALLYWTLDGVAFTDLWAVRRPLAPADAGRGTMLPGPAALAKGELRWLQFQAQIESLVDDDALPASIRARDWFRYLPSAGLLPIDTLGPITSKETRFFEDLAVRFPRPPDHDVADGPEFMEGAGLNALLRQSFAYPPIDTQSEEGIWLYRIRENRHRLETDPSARHPTVLVFATAHMPYFATPRFDVARLEYSNLASTRLGPDGL